MTGERKLKAVAAEWLASSQFNTLATVTLKQGIQKPEGWVRINGEEARRVAWLLRDRVTKAALGGRRVRAGDRLTFLPFIEGGTDKRLHLHVCVERPESINEVEFAAKFKAVARGLDWVHSEIDVRPVPRGGGNTDRVLQYCLKEGTAAFCVEACHLPEISGLVGS